MTQEWHTLGAGRAFLRVVLDPRTGISQACAVGVLLLLTHGLPQEGFGAVLFARNVQSDLVAVGTFGLTSRGCRGVRVSPPRRQGANN